MRKFNFSIQILIHYNGHFISIFKESINQFELMSSERYLEFCNKYGNVLVINNNIKLDGDYSIKKPRYSIYLPLLLNSDSIDYMKGVISDCLFLMQMSHNKVDATVKNITNEIESCHVKNLWVFYIQLNNDDAFALQKEKYELCKKYCFEQLKDDDNE